MKKILFIGLWCLAFSSLAQKIGYQEKVYVHISKPYFVVGETLHYSVYVTNATTGEPGTPSGLLQVRIHDNLGRRIANQAVQLQNGIGAGSVSLPDTLTGQVYHLIAYTNYQRNFEDSHVFKQSFPVYNLNGLRRAESASEKVELELQHYFDGSNLHLYTTDQGFPTKSNLTINGQQMPTNELGYLKTPINSSAEVDVSVEGSKGIINRTISVEEPELKLKETIENYVVSFTSKTDNPVSIQLVTKGVMVFEKSFPNSKSIIQLPFDKKNFPPGLNQIRLVASSGEQIGELQLTHQPEIHWSLSYDTTAISRRRILTISGKVEEIQDAMVSISVYPELLILENTQVPITDYFQINSELTDAPSIPLGDQLAPYFYSARNYGAPGSQQYGFEKETLVLDGIPKPSHDALFVAVFDDRPLFDFLKSDTDKKTLGFAGGEEMFGAKVFLSTVEELYDADFYQMNLQFANEKWKVKFYGDSAAVLNSYYKNARENVLLKRMYEGTKQADIILPYQIPSISSWDERYDFSEYIDLGTLGIAMSQLVAEVKFKKKENGQYSVKIEKENLEGVAIAEFEQEALVLLNGMPVSDYQKILDMPFNTIDSVHVIQQPLSYYGWEVGGVFSIFTKDPLETNILHFDKQPIDMPELANDEAVAYKSINARHPHFVNQVYWQAMQKIENGRISFDLMVPDNSEDLIIDIQGISSEGQPISIRERIVR